MAIFYQLNKVWVALYRVDFFKNDRTHLDHRLSQPYSLNFQGTTSGGRICNVKVHEIFTRLYSLLFKFFILFAFDSSKIFVGLSNVKIWISRQKCEIRRWNDLTKDTLRPLVSRLMLILYLEVLADKARRHFDNLNYLELQNEELPSQIIYLEDHLVGDRVDIFGVNLEDPREETKRKGKCLSV